MRKRSTLFTAIAIAILAPGCERRSPDEGAADPEPTVTTWDSAGIEIVENHAPEWEESEFWTIDSAPEFVLGGSEDLGALANDSAQLIWETVGIARLEDGRIAVLSSMGKQLLLFHSSGELSRTIGRGGEGPGEFTRPEWLQYLPPDTLVVWDYFLTSIDRFDTTGTLLSERRVDHARLREMGAWGEGFRLPLADGSFVVAVMDETDSDSPDDCSHLALKGRSRGEEFTLQAERRFRIDDTPATYPLGCASAFISTMAAGGDPESIYISTDAKEVHQRSLDGTLLRIIRRTTEPPPVTGRGWEQELENRDKYREMMGWDPREEGEEEVIRRTVYPGIVDLVVDSEGHLWVREWSDSESGVPDQWSVFSPEGRWLGALAFPPDPAAPDQQLCRRYATPCWIGKDHFVLVRRDELGVERVEGYRIRRGGWRGGSAPTGRRLKWRPLGRKEGQCQSDLTFGPCLQSPSLWRGAIRPRLTRARPPKSRHSPPGTRPESRSSRITPRGTRSASSGPSTPCRSSCWAVRTTAAGLPTTPIN